MKIINYLFIIAIIILGTSSCGKSGSLFLSNDDNLKWVKINDPNEE